MQRTPQAASDWFIERMGLSAQADGLPRIAGRIFGFFIMEGRPCSFSELAERLQVSRGSISTNTRLLESLGVLERVVLPGDRQDYFQLSEDPYGRLMVGALERMRRIETVVKQARQDLASANPQAGRRLDEMAQFYKAAIDSTDQLIQNWRTGQDGKDS